MSPVPPRRLACRQPREIHLKNQKKNYEYVSNFHQCFAYFKEFQHDHEAPTLTVFILLIKQEVQPFVYVLRSATSNLPTFAHALDNAPGGVTLERHPGHVVEVGRPVVSNLKEKEKEVTLK